MKNHKSIVLIDTEKVNKQSTKSTRALPRTISETVNTILAKKSPMFYNKANRGPKYISRIYQLEEESPFLSNYLEEPIPMLAVLQI